MDGVTPESGENPETESSSRVISAEFIEGVFDTVRTGLENELEALEAAKPDKLSPISEQISHANDVARNVAGQEIAERLQTLILGQS